MVDGGWPRIYALPSGGSVLVYQPQVSSWDRQLHLVAFAALSYSAKATEKPTPGTIKLEVDTKVSHEERLVGLQNMKIVEINIPTIPKDRVQEVAAEIDKAIPDDERVIALDRVLANIDKSQIVPRNVEGVKADPPAIFFSKTPAVIVNLDGEPIWSPIMGNDLEVRGQHQLGPLPARDDQQALSAQQRHVVDGQRPPRSVVAGRKAA